MLYTATSGSGKWIVDSGKLMEDDSTIHYPLSTIRFSGPIAIRYPRGVGIGVPLAAEGFREIPIGQGEMMRDGEDVAIVGVGPILYEALKAAEDLEREGISVAVANARFAKPLDTALLDGIAARFKHIVTIEENAVQGGFGSAVAEYLAHLATLHPSSLIPHPSIIGIPDEFIEHGSPQGLLDAIGLNRESIRDRVRALVGQGVAVRV